MSTTTNHRTATAEGGDRSTEPRVDTAVEPAHAGRTRGAVLVLGAIIMALVVQPIGPLDFYWLPFLVGVTFTAAAAATGPRSPLWGAGIVVAFWGLSKVIGINIDLSWGGAFSTMMIGVGGLLAAYLASRHFSISVASVAFPVVFIGVGQYIHGTFSGWPITSYTCGLAALYGVVELVNHARQSREPAATRG